MIVAGAASRERAGWLTPTGIAVQRETRPCDPGWVESLAAELDERRGALLSCGVEVGGHRARDVGFVDPPLAVTAQAGELRIEALTARGEQIAAILRRALERHPDVHVRAATGTELTLTPHELPHDWAATEEWRTRRSPALAALRAIVDVLRLPAEPLMGLYGAFAYDLVREFEDLGPTAAGRTAVLYLPDRVLTLDRGSGKATEVLYDLALEGAGSTEGLARDRVPAPFAPRAAGPATADFGPGEFAALVRDVKQRFAAGDLFELVPSRGFRQPCSRRPSEVFLDLRRDNPAPYGTLMNLGGEELLVGASPEMYVRVRGREIETNPISGTAPRGPDPMTDADRARELLASDKDESELTMCTDVDRNDKARVCEPGSVRVVARRVVEAYARLLHTVDRVHGTLREPFDALDAFATHMWASTVTGAPKLHAMRELGRVERTPRRWYGGAFGWIGFDGGLDTGMTLRTIQVRGGVAEVRAGCTLLWQSDPDEEERETELKASAFLAALREPSPGGQAPRAVARPVPRRRVLVVDHEDSFVNTLASYFRETGANVDTVRWSLGPAAIRSLAGELGAGLVVLSPGPGRPADFSCGRLLAELDRADIPIFGVCLGLQALVEHFGGRLDTLAEPWHGVASRVRHDGGRVLAGVPAEFIAGRYHSLHAPPASVVPPLRVTARAEDGTVMAVEHESRPIAAVQFHPESLMTLRNGLGQRIVTNVVERLR